MTSPTASTDTMYPMDKPSPIQRDVEDLTVQKQQQQQQQQQQQLLLPLRQQQTTGYSPSSSTFECLGRLEIQKNQWIDEWLQMDVPLLDGILQVSENVYQLFFIVKHLINGQKQQKQYWNQENNIWYCNSIQNPGKYLVQNGPIHIIECTIPPDTTRSNKNGSDHQESTNRNGGGSHYPSLSLSSLSSSSFSLQRVWPSQPSLKTNRTIYYTESCLTAYIECDQLERQEIHNHVPFSSTIESENNKRNNDTVVTTPFNNSHSDNNDNQTTTRSLPLLGACIIERKVDPSHLAQWIIYHRLMGVDHFWIYQNEPSRPLGQWEGRRRRRGDKDDENHHDDDDDDITYIPYNFVWEDHAGSSTSYRIPPREIFWQEAMQVRCIYHAKRLGYKWIITTDVDEYIWVNITDYHPEQQQQQQQQQQGQGSKPNNTYPLKQYLIDHSNEFDAYAGLVMNSVFFGRYNDEPTIANTSHPSLVMDYVWRRVNPEWQRYKQIYHIPKVYTAGVHYVSGQGGSYNLEDVYFHHYKTPWQGVFKSKQKPMMRDTRLKALYRKHILAELQDFRPPSSS